jgi:hypothetical protein
VRGTIVTLDGLDHGTIYGDPDIEFEVLTEPVYVAEEGAERTTFGGKGYVRVRPLDPKILRRMRGSFLVVPVVHTREVRGAEGPTDV